MKLVKSNGKNLLIALILILSLAQTNASRAAPNAAYIVNTAVDPGPATCTAVACSLRAAVNASNAGGPSGNHTIQFNLTYPVTITLASSLPAITGTLAINGPAVGQLVISGNGNRVFTVGSLGILSMSGLTVAKGNDIFQGGGILVDHGRLAIHDILFRDNLSSGEGGGLYNNGGKVEIADTIFSANNSFHVGAIGNTGTMTVTNSLFINNLARVAGAILNDVGGSLLITGTTFTGNDATQTSGGAIQNEGTLIIANSTFDNNGALQGADLANDGTAHITNSTLTNVDTRSGNSIDSPSASAALTIRNSILDAGNGIPNCSVSAGTLDVDASNLATDSSCASATVKTEAQLNLGPLKINLGNTPTHSPMPGSAAIDAGNDAICAAAIGAPDYGAGGVDQRGIPRPQGAHCDVGAVEFITIYTVYLPLI